MKTVRLGRRSGRFSVGRLPTDFQLRSPFSFFSLNKRFKRFFLVAQLLKAFVKRFYPFLSVFKRSVGVLSVLYPFFIRFCTRFDFLRRTVCDQSLRAGRI